MLEGWLSAQAERRVRIVAPKRGEKRGLLDLAARNAELAYQARFNENVAAQLRRARDASHGARPARRAATDRVLRHFDDPGQRDRRVDGRLRRRPDEEVGVSEVQDPRPVQLGRFEPRVSVFDGECSRGPDPPAPAPASSGESRAGGRPQGLAHTSSTTLPPCTRSSSAAIASCSRTAGRSRTSS